MTVKDGGTVEWNQPGPETGCAVNGRAGELGFGLWSPEDHAWVPDAELYTVGTGL